LACQDGLSKRTCQLVSNFNFSTFNFQLSIFTSLSYCSCGERETIDLIRLITELHVIQCGDGADEPHNTLFTGCLSQPLECQSSVHGRRQMSRLTFQDATHLRRNYDSQFY